MTHPLVSIVITTKNEERNIENCLLSIKEQTYSNIEIILVMLHSILLPFGTDSLFPELEFIFIVIGKLSLYYLLALVIKIFFAPSFCMYLPAFIISFKLVISMLLMTFASAIFGVIK